MATLIHKGKSAYNGEEILGAVTQSSSNKKTGKVDTLWILPAKEEPHAATKSGGDASICGDCPHRRDHGALGDCYVLPFQAPLSIFRSLKRSGFVQTLLGRFKAKGKTLRLGGYGDPAMLPEGLVASLVDQYKSHLGYTHQWERKWAAWTRRFCMASVDSVEQAKKAWSKGWRTFRVSYDGVMAANEILCPSVTHGVQCADCTLCNGATDGDKRKNIVILAHGAKSVRLITV